MNTILHLERNFLKKTESFIFNQINSIKNFNIKICAINNYNSFEKDFDVILPSFSANSNFLKRNVTNTLYQKISVNNIDLIHSHYLTDASYFYPLTSKFDCPKICSVYGYDVSEFPKRFLGLGKFYLKRVFMSYDKIIAMSPDMENDLISIGCPSEKILVHYYGTDVSRYVSIIKDYSLTNNILKILTIGSLFEKKGHESVLKSLSLLKDIINFEYNIVGEGPLFEYLRNLSIELNIDDRVNFLGHVPYNNNISYYQNADLFILTSVTSKTGNKEGIPGVIVEGMASGLPVISTKHAGIPYVLRQDETGLLACENDYETIASYILSLYESEHLRKSLGIKAREYAQNYLNLEIQSNKLELIYKSFIF